MSTKRVPIKRPSRSQLTPRAIELFREMQALPECSCVVGPEYWQKQECARCGQWRELHSRLHRELRLAPWQWPAIAEPGRECAWPSYTAGGIWHPEAQRLWRELERTAAETGGAT